MEPRDREPKSGLTEAEAEEYESFSIMHIGEVTQEDWVRFHELNDKYIRSIIWAFDRNIP